MNDSTVSSTEQQAQGRAPGPAGRTGGAAEVSDGLEWLLLTHHLPSEPAYLRVKVRRRLERIGAVPLKNSVYVLPPGDDTREDFEWLRREIERNGGEVTVCAATFLDETTDGRLVHAFREARDPDYEAIAQEATELLRRYAVESMDGEKPFELQSHRTRLRRQLDETIAVDFFGAPRRDAAERALAEMESLMRRDRSERRQDAADALGRPPGPVGRTWVTRRGVKEDRIASAWLIRRFIDPAASFKFVPVPGYRPRDGEVRFDMYEGEFTHEDDSCTLEVLIARFGLDDPALVALGEIVHDIDCKDEKFGRPEVAGVASLIEGITRMCDDDEERLARGAAVFDGLYEHFSV